MKNILIKKADTADSNIITEYLKKMLLDMSEYGGYPVSSSDKNWSEISETIKSNINNENHIFILVVEKEKSKIIAFGEAKIFDINPVFELIKQIHISAIFVENEYRKKGIGKLIVNELIRIGKERGCHEAELNVILNNPAYFLYKKIGFKEFRVNMRKKI
ncbi:MAG: GNAT family N-acetyltransferase [Candidatus Sericytochromatia bacterium]